MNKRITFFIFILILFAWSCKSGTPSKNILPLDSMKVVMMDFLIADEWNNARAVTDTVFVKSKNNLKTYQQVFAIHHTTKAVFDSSLNYYEQDPEMFKVLMDSVHAYGSRLRNHIPSPRPVKKTLIKKIK